MCCAKSSGLERRQIQVGAYDRQEASSTDQTRITPDSLKGACRTYMAPQPLAIVFKPIYERQQHLWHLGAY